MRIILDPNVDVSAVVAAGVCAERLDRWLTSGPFEFGVAGPDGGTPDEATSFQMGPVTKVVTELLLAAAVMRGEVALDQPLTSAFPSAAPHQSGQPIRLVDLATHTSGLPRPDIGAPTRSSTSLSDRSVDV